LTKTSGQYSENLPLYVSVHGYCQPQQEAKYVLMFMGALVD